MGQGTANADGLARGFKTTRWSLILSLGPDADDARTREALAQLCRIYWRPIFAYLVRRGASPEDAQDLTQEFFMAILKGDLLRQADPGRGRFRWLLLTALQNFARDARAKLRTVRRGGDKSCFVPWDEWLAEAPSCLTLSTATLEDSTPEKIFDVRWAATLAEGALGQLQEECAARGRQRVFDTLSGALLACREEVCYRTLAAELNVNTTDVKRVLHRLRQRYRQLLRQQVADTLEDPADVDEELRYLVATLAVSPSS